MQLLKEYIRAQLILETHRDGVILYHIGDKPPEPKPRHATYIDYSAVSIDDEEFWDIPVRKQRKGKIKKYSKEPKWRKYSVAEGPWERPWLKEPIEVGVFLTPRPDLVAERHGIKGRRIYIYRVPRWVVKSAGGIHTFENAPEVIIDKNLWDSARKEIKLLGSRDFQSLIHDLSLSRTPLTGGGEWSNISLEKEEYRKARKWFKLEMAKRPKEVISFMTEREKEEMLDSIATWRRIAEPRDLEYYRVRAERIEMLLKGKKA